MRLLVDHNYIARALAAVAEPDGHEVKAKPDKFDTSVPIPDTEWLGVLVVGIWRIVPGPHARGRTY